MGFRLPAAALCALAFVLIWPLAPSDAKAATLERVAENGVIKLGFREDAAPFSYLTKDNKVAGYSVALCEAVAGAVRNHLKRDDIKVELVPVTAESRFIDLEAGRVDLLCGADTVTLERRQRVDFSLLTFVTGSSVLYRKDGPADFVALAGQKVGVRGGTTTEAGLKRALSDAGIAAQVVALDSHEAGRSALEAKEISAYFADRAILIMLAAGAEKPQDLALSQRFFSYEPYALALQRGDSDFRLLVDTTLVRLYRSQAVGKIYQGTFGNVPMSDLLRAVFIVQALPE
ncbi:amino acid ABC transporter substrate-binding protein [Pelagibius marinus]|uniref:amino acid ABC transporter substrate-binding protein n=1 Tax=Pelagibius marinus TaxID=2762760 RepID=UPI0018722C9F|nr:amino acid ABC transporter substrate-binding protein [Pelagibius marinus]